MQKNIKKAVEIEEADISFVSLVDKAANKRQFLITKSKDGKGNFASEGRIIKTVKDGDARYITGIVYEPMTVDTDGNFMTEAAITKAAHRFIKGGGMVDVQHSFKEADNCAIVESYVTKDDCEIAGVAIKKGTWLVTAESTDPVICKAIDEGKLTGFSMGGTGQFATEDVDIEPEAIAKQSDGDDQQAGKFISMICKAFGFEVPIKKGEVAQKFNASQQRKQFFEAFDALRSTLCYYDPKKQSDVIVTDPAKVKSALADFSKIVSEVLKSDDVIKEIAKSINESEENSEMTEQEIKKYVDEAVEKAIASEDNSVKKEEAAEVTTDTVQAMVQKAVDDAIKKADESVEQNAATLKEGIDIEAEVKKAVEAAMQPIYKSRGMATNLNTEGDVKKEADGHYLAGVL